MRLLTSNHCTLIRVSKEKNRQLSYFMIRCCSNILKITVQKTSIKNLSRKTPTNHCSINHSIFEQRQNSVTNCSYQTELYKDIINKEIGAQSELLGLF